MAKGIEALVVGQQWAPGVTTSTSIGDRHLALSSLIAGGLVPLQLGEKPSQVADTWSERSATQVDGTLGQILDILQPGNCLSSRNTTTYFPA